MPPVADDFVSVLERLLREGAGGLTTWRQLAARLNELDDRQSLDDWKASINRYRRPDGPSPKEDRIALFARAFRVSRDVFPPAVSRRSRAAEMAALREEIADVAARIARIERALEEREATGG